MTLTESHAKLLKDGESSQAGTILNADREGKADLSYLEQRSYVKTYGVLSGDIHFTTTQRGLAALVEFERQKIDANSWRKVTSFFVREYKWILGAIGAIFLVWLGSWLN